MTAPSLAEQIEACELVYAYDSEHTKSLRAAAATLRSLAEPSDGVVTDDIVAIEPPSAEPTQCGPRRMANRLLALQPRVRTGVTFVLVDICDRDEIVQMLRNCADYVKQAAMPSTMGMESSQEDTDGSAAAPIAEPSDEEVRQMANWLRDHSAGVGEVHVLHAADLLERLARRVDDVERAQAIRVRAIHDGQRRIAALEQQLAAAKIAMGQGPRDEEFSRERLLYLIRQDFECLPECNSYGHAENCPYVGGPAQLDELTRQRDEAKQQLAAAQAQHSELLYAVASKYPGESSHETALRYIRQAESGHVGSGIDAAQSQESK